MCVALCCSGSVFSPLSYVCNMHKSKPMLGTLTLALLTCPCVHAAENRGEDLTPRLTQSEEEALAAP